MHVLLECWGSVREQSTRGGTELGDHKIGHQLWSPASISAFPLQDGPDEDFRKSFVFSETSLTSSLCLYTKGYFDCWALQNCPLMSLDKQVSSQAHIMAKCCSDYAITSAMEKNKTYLSIFKIHVILPVTKTESLQF